MGLPDRSYFHLGELMRRWSVTMDDLGCYVIDGFLQVSTFVFGLELEEGSVQKGDDGALFTIIHDYRTANGLQPLISSDAWSVFRNGTGKITRFLAAEPDAYVALRRDGQSLLLTLDDIVVSRVERDRFESEFDLVVEESPSHATPKLAPTFTHNDGYSEVALHGEIFRLGPVQASIVKRLHAQAKLDDPWVHQSELLKVANSDSSRLSDLFKRKDNWQTLILGDRRGKFRLNLGKPARSGGAVYRRFGMGSWQTRSDPLPVPLIPS